METGRVPLARNEQAMRVARRAESEHQETIARLMNLLNASMKEHGRDFAKHMLDVDRAHGHVGLTVSQCMRSQEGIVTQGSPKPAGPIAGPLEASYNRRRVFRA